MSEIRKRFRCPGGYLVSSHYGHDCGGEGNRCRGQCAFEERRGTKYRDFSEMPVDKLRAFATDLSNAGRAARETR